MRKIYPEKDYGANGSAEPVRCRAIPKRVGRCGLPHALLEPSAPPCVITTQARNGTHSGTPNGGGKAAGSADAKVEGDADVMADGIENAEQQGASSVRSVTAAAGEGPRRDAPNGSTETAGGSKRSCGDVRFANGPDPPLKRAKDNV